MNYYLFKLHFNTAVHFGPSDSALSLYTSEDHFCADTLFAALCHAAKAMNGTAGVEALCRQAAGGQLLLSDSMPYHDGTLYIPKPCVSNDSSTELPADQRKAAKKLAWIPLDTISSFADSVHGRGVYDIKGAKASFGVHGEGAKAAVTEGENARPFQVGLYQFYPGCGLWFLAGCAAEEQGDSLKGLIEGLGLSGIGGKTTAGYGKFRLEACIHLNRSSDGGARRLLDALEFDAAPRQLLLSTSLPSDAELEKLLPSAEFRLTRRGGFVQSADYAPEDRKKRAQYFLSAGSVLPARFSPALYSVGEAGRHPVYRFSGPVLLGVEL